jgi:hypothetical protein
MSGIERATITELVELLGNDQARGGATRELLAVRRVAVDDAAAARDAYAYRQALLELSACALALAARMPAPAGSVPRVSSGAAAAARGRERSGGRARPAA